LLISIAGLSQGGIDLNKCTEVTKKKAIKLYTKALDNLSAGNTREARSLLNEAKKVEPSFAEVYYQLGLIKWKMAEDAAYDYRKAANAERYYNSAVKNFEKVIKYCPKTADFEAFYYLGIYHYKRKNYAKALDYLDIYVKHSASNPAKKKEVKKILSKMSKIAFLVKHPVPFEPHKLYEISTPKDEFLPLISPDGELAFFTRRYAKFIKETQTKRWLMSFLSAKG
jgi:tetratricopeptide (TPR) repeat protein